MMGHGVTHALSMTGVGQKYLAIPPLYNVLTHSSPPANLTDHPPSNPTETVLSDERTVRNPCHHHLCI
jgi:hypothetical protein